jgi:CHAD domain-containing protein
LHDRSLLVVIDTERSAAHRGLVEAMGTVRWQAMLDMLDAAAVMPPLAPAIAPTSRARGVIRPLLHKSWRRLERRVDAAQANDTSWHEVRKSAKSLRYAAELLQPFLGTAAERLAKDSERIQTQLGKEQDGLVAREWLANHADDERTGSTVRRLADRFEDRSDRRPAHWKSMWKRLRRTAEPIA